MNSTNGFVSDWRASRRLLPRSQHPALKKLLHALENTTETNRKHDRAQINGRPRHPRPIIINGKAFDIGDAPRCSVHRDKVNPAKSLILWSAPKEARQAGYKPKSKKVWKGVAPNKEECDLIRREAWLLEHEFQVWQRANPVAEQPQPPVSLEEHRAKRNSHDEPPPPASPDDYRNSGSVGAAEQWRKQLLRNKNGEVRANLANALIALRHDPVWQGVLGHDEFAGQTVMIRRPPFAAGQNNWSPRAWLPNDDALTTEWMQHAGIGIRTDIAAQAIETAARNNIFHPVRDYLSGLVWDCKERVARWLSIYLGVEQSPYAQDVGRSALVAAVARVMRPGCKADHVLILEGPQAVGKSDTIKILGGAWFTDEIADLGSKDAAMQTAGTWLIEVAELDAMSRTEVSKIKAFITRTTDRFRPPYGRRVVEVPRQCVFWGSTNSDEFLKDETGGRRFWPVKVTNVDRTALRRDRDQLWAEAVALFKGGSKWWITDSDVARAAEVEQQQRYVRDPWQSAIEGFVANRDDTSVEEIFDDLFHMDKSRRTQIDQTRIARALKAANFERYQRRAGQIRHWRYRRRER
jgi:predicted P-loop ATPase